MIPLTEATRLRINAMFPESQQQTVAVLLEEKCGDNLPFYENATPASTERVRFAALKFSQGTMDGMEEALALAYLDWRDLFMATGFGEDTTAHTRWFPDPLKH